MRGERIEEEMKLDWVGRRRKGMARGYERLRAMMKQSAIPSINPIVAIFPRYEYNDRKNGDESERTKWWERLFFFFRKVAIKINGRFFVIIAIIRVAAYGGT